jgi:LacI family transcriptional regulator
LNPNTNRYLGVEKVVTIKEVAKLAGVAVSTASNAINNKYGVKPETRKRVLDAARKLNYIPNPYAQGLVTNSKRNVSIIFSGPASSNYFTNPSFDEVVKSITQTLNENGYQAQLNIFRRDEEGTEIPRIAQSRVSDAIILLTTRTPDDVLEKILDEVSIPSIVLMRSAPSDQALCISLDNVKCGYIATKYLIDNGHKRIGFIGALQGVSIADQRLEGYKKALHEAGIEYDETLVVEGDYYQESGLIGVRNLLRQTPKKPTAIFTGNDLMALGVMEGLEQEGIAIPEDISLISCDNIPNLHLLRVPLTTIASPFYEIGRLAAKKAIGVIEMNDALPDQIVMTSEIRIRKSVKNLL